MSERRGMKKTIQCQTFKISLEWARVEEENKIADFINGNDSVKY